jgi:hypothetical protein
MGDLLGEIGFRCPNHDPSAGQSTERRTATPLGS